MQVKIGVSRNVYREPSVFGAREMQGRHDVVGGARDAGIADEIGHGRDADGKQHARDPEDDHQFQQRESGLGSFHG